MQNVTEEQKPEYDEATLFKVLGLLLKVRNTTLGLISEAEQLKLVAYNAAISSSRLGAQGRVFASLTGEINTLTSGLRSQVNETCDLIKTHTYTMARVTNAHRNYDYAVKSITKLSDRMEKGRSLAGLQIYSNNILQQNAQRLEAIAEGVGKLRRAIHDIPRHIDFFNAVRIQLIVEAGAATGIVESAQLSYIKTFDHLAENIEKSCKAMRQSLQGCEELLEEAENILTIDEREAA